MVFAPGLVKVLLRPRPDYVPKVALNPLRFQQVVLEALSPTEVGSENLSLCPVKIFTILHHPYCCYVYTRYNLFAHSSCTFLLILTIQYTVLHILFYCTFYSLFFLIIFILYLYLYIYSSVVLNFLHYPLSGPDLTYISLLIISCIIEYVTNKQTLNLEP